MAEPACNLLNWGYKSVAIDSTTRISHKRLYHGDCELVQLPFELFCPIVNAKMRDVTSDVILPAGVAKRMRDFAADVEADLEGRAYPLTSEAQLNARFWALVGKGVVEVVNACIVQKQPTWSRLAFTAEARPSNLFCWPDFLIKQNRVDVCGGVGKMPNAMDYAFDLVTRPYVAVDDALMQACSYCQEKKWRFTFITYYELTFFVWRVAEDKYAVTDGFLHDGAPYGLHTREALAYIMWMALEAPWGKQLSEQDNGALQALEKQLRQQVAVKVLRGKPKEDNKDPSDPSQLQHNRSLASGGERQNQTTGTAYYAAHQKDQPPSWIPIRDAPEYPLTAL